MTKATVIQFLQAASQDEQLQAKVKDAQNYEEFRSLAEQSGFDMGNVNDEQIQDVVREVTGQATGNLSDEELELVAGGIMFLPGTYTSEGVRSPAGPSVQRR